MNLIRPKPVIAGVIVLVIVAVVGYYKYYTVGGRIDYAGITCGKLSETSCSGFCDDCDNNGLRCVSGGTYWREDFPGDWREHYCASDGCVNSCSETRAIPGSEYCQCAD